jgi:hypothetical protein
MPENLVAMARSPLFQFLARICMIFVTTIGVPAGGFIASRVIGTLDRISEKQDTVRSEINLLNQALIRMEGDNRVINARIENVNRDFTSRVDALSAWTRRNSDEIDKVKDWFLKPGSGSK